VRVRKAFGSHWEGSPPQVNDRSPPLNSSSAEQGPVASRAATGCGLCCAFATCGGRSGEGEKRARSKVQGYGTGFGRPARGQLPCFPSTYCSPQSGITSVSDHTKRPACARLARRRSVTEWSQSQDTVNGRSGNRSGGVLGLARKQIELWSSTAPSTSQGPRAEPGWWRESGVPLNNQRRANGRVSTLPTRSGGFLLLHSFEKSGFALTPIAWVVGEWAGLKQLRAVRVGYRDFFFSFFSRLTVTSRALLVHQVRLLRGDTTRGTGGDS
jgi:hypothetical protein